MSRLSYRYRRYRYREPVYIQPGPAGRALLVILAVAVALGGFAAGRAMLHSDTATGQELIPVESVAAGTVGIPAHLRSVPRVPALDRPAPQKHAIRTTRALTRPPSGGSQRSDRPPSPAPVSSLPRAPVTSSPPERRSSPSRAPTSTSGGSFDDSG